MSARASHPIRRLPAAAGGAAVLTLAASMVAGPGGSTVPTVILGAAAVVLLALALGARARLLDAEVGLGTLGLVALVVANLAAVYWLLSSVAVARALVPAAMLVAGGALIGLTLARTRDDRGDALTPWQSMTADTTSRTSGRALRTLGPGLAGTFLVIVACGVLVRHLAVYGAAWALLGTVMLTVATVAPAAFATRWVALSRTPASAAPARSDAQVAAHLHDSVLQTLALIRRSADDPGRVGRLARAQERDLRDWLAGRDADRADTLGPALRAAAREVEDSHPDAAIEVVAVGDTPLTAALQAMVDAAREAMLNAARHAGTRIQVYAECEAEGVVTVYVRDTGPGFVLDDVPPQRRGVRDAIIGRMDSVGGEAVIDSGEAGTEVTLRLTRGGGG